MLIMTTDALSRFHVKLRAVMKENLYRRQFRFVFVVSEHRGRVKAVSVLCLDQKFRVRSFSWTQHNNFMKSVIKLLIQDRLDR